ncbi:Mpv17 / PMP22 family [Musa troglodytarum]|uniref:Mpv17 / PMP22 family n=1 Tax=Musa troglodytarum TaxID=320322 RepID=A0A9E7GFG1_9LILI|nr:Mpv17 / PMP22 family [Musa troglodytarum]
MSGYLLRYGGRGAHNLLLRHLRAPRLRRELSKPSTTRARAYVRSQFLSSKFKDPSPGFYRASPSLFTPSLCPATAASSSSSTLNSFVSWYLGMIGARPVLTKSLTAGTISFAADISSQIMLSSSGSLDFTRTLRMAGYGMLVAGPSLHFWFIFVSRILPKRDILTTFKKMALQTIYISLNAGLQGESSAEIFARIKRDLIPTLKIGDVYCPFCDFITFKFIPVRLQITYMASLEKANVEILLKNQ